MFNSSAELPKKLKNFQSYRNESQFRKLHKLIIDIQTMSGSIAELNNFTISKRKCDDHEFYIIEINIKNKPMNIARLISSVDDLLQKNVIKIQLCNDNGKKQRIRLTVPSETMNNKRIEIKENKKKDMNCVTESLIKGISRKKIYNQKIKNSNTNVKYLIEKILKTLYSEMPLSCANISHDSKIDDRLEVTLYTKFNKTPSINIRKLHTIASSKYVNINSASINGEKNMFIVKFSAISLSRRRKNNKFIKTHTIRKKRRKFSD